MVLSQETLDGHLVVFHDFKLARAYHHGGGGSSSSCNAQAAAALLSDGVDVLHACVQEVTLAQLQSLHLGGRKGVKAPSLKEFLQVANPHLTQPQHTCEGVSAGSSPLPNPTLIHLLRSFCR